MGKRFVYLLLSALTLLAATSTATKVFFSSQESVQGEITRLIAKSRTSIDVALFELRSPTLVRELEGAEARGVLVRVVLDASRPAYRTSLRHIRWLGGKRPKRRGVMHNKFSLFDGASVITGSYNWTAGAEYSNYENAIFIDDEAVAKSYKREFDRLWSRAGARPSVGWGVSRISTLKIRVRRPHKTRKKDRKHPPRLMLK